MRTVALPLALASATIPAPVAIEIDAAIPVFLLPGDAAGSLLDMECQPRHRPLTNQAVANLHGCELPFFDSADRYSVKN